MKRITLFFLCALFLTLYPLAEEGNIKFERISIEDGLSQNTVSAIIQDQKGFMWFATQEGLNRYDGYEFKIYWHEPDNPNSLSHNYVSTIVEDREGVLWIGTFGGGLNKFNVNTGTFVLYRKKDGLPNNVIHGILEASIPEPAADSSPTGNMGNLWLSTNKGLCQFNPGVGVVENYGLGDGLQSDEFIAGAFQKLF